MQEAGVDKRTGEIIRRPGTEFSWTDSAGRHVLLPDPGWSYNPSQGAALYDALTGRGGRLATTLPDPAVVPGNRSWRDYGLPATLLRRPAPPVGTPAEDADQAKRAIWDAIGGARGSYHVVETPAGLDDVTITDRFVDHLVDHHLRKEARERFADFVLPTMRDSEEVWLLAVEGPTGRIVYRPAVRGRLPGSRWPSRSPGRTGRIVGVDLPHRAHRPAPSARPPALHTSGGRVGMPLAMGQSLRLPECADYHGTGRVRTPHRRSAPPAATRR